MSVSHNSIRRHSTVHLLVLEGAARYESCQCLVFLSLAVRLPPVGILLTYHMQNITFLKTDTQLPTWDVKVFFRIIIKMCLHVHL